MSAEPAMAVPEVSWPRPPRPYQLEAVEAFDSGVRRGSMWLAIVLPTGTGKTFTAWGVAAQVLMAGGRVLWLAHRGELLKQGREALAKFLPSVAEQAVTYGPTARTFASAAVFMSTQSLQAAHRQGRLRALVESGAPDLIVYDEVHHFPAPGNSAAVDELVRLVEEVSGSAPQVLGLTATPGRMGRQQLGDRFELAYSYPIRKAIAEGYLCPFRHAVVRMEKLDLSTVKQTAGDYDAHELAEAMMMAGVVEHTLNAVRQHAPARRGVIFAPRVECARQMAVALTEAGFPAGVVAGSASMKQVEREAALEAHQRGDLQYLVNVDVLTEGYDDPTIDVVIIARPTRSKSLYLQAIGRGLRLSPETGKTECLIIDIAGASEEHDTVQAPALLGSAPKRKRNSNDEEGGGAREAGPRSAYKGLFDSRAKSKFAWLPLEAYLDRDVSVVDVPGTGVVAVVEAEPGSGLWQAALLRIPRGTDGRAGSRMELLTGNEAVSYAEAIALGDDLLRQAPGGRSTYAEKEADFRAAEPSQAQLRVLERFGVSRLPETKGEASDLITMALGYRAVVWHGLACRAVRP